MANMSYCRFRNTMMDLDDCLYALEEGEEIGNEELDACKRMFKKFINFCIDQGIIEQDGEIDDRLKDFINSLNKE